MNYLTATGFRIAPLAVVVPLVVDCVAASGESNSAGLRGVKEERMEELRLSRSRASRALVERCNGELPFSRWEGMADLGFGPGGGGDPEPMTVQRGK